MSAERVARGAVWLDERSPGWWKALDLDRLDQASNEQCVLGQTFGNYMDAPDECYDWIGYGFTCESDDERAWLDLTRAWLLLIAARRASARVAV